MIAPLFGTGELRATDHGKHGVVAKIAFGLTGDSRKLFGRFFSVGGKLLAVVGEEVLVFNFQHQEHRGNQCNSPLACSSGKPN